MLLVRYCYNALFVIVHVRCCPTAMVPVASWVRGRLHTITGEGRSKAKSCSVSYCKRTSTQCNRLPPTLLIEKEVVWALLPVTCTLKEGLPRQDPPPDITQDFLINKVPVDWFPDFPPSSCYAIIDIILSSLITWIRYRTIRTYCITISSLFGILLQYPRVSKYSWYIYYVYPCY